MVPAGNPSLFLQSIKFDLLRKYHFLTLSACGLRGDESHLLPRWAGHSKLANQHISFPWGWFQVEHMIKPGQWDSLWGFFWNFWEKGIGFLLGWPVCCLVATLPSVDITSSGESQHRGWQNHEMQDTDYQLHYLNNWVQLGLSPHFVNRQFFLCVLNLNLFELCICHLEWEDSLPTLSISMSFGIYICPMLLTSCVTWGKLYAFSELHFFFVCF